MDEFEVRDELREKREAIQGDFDKLVNLLADIRDNYDSGYGEAPRAIAQASLAVADYFAKKFGITCFQAGAVMWDFIRDWNFKNNKCGLKIIDYDDMLYPQYEDKFEKTISKETFAALQDEAKAGLEESQYGKRFAHYAVVAHWKSIVDGKVPFGYSIRKER